MHINFNTQSTHFHPIEQKPPITKAQITQIALAALEGLAILGSVLLLVEIISFSVSPLAGFGLIPLIAMGIFVGYSLYTLKDYDDPKKIEIYRKDCQNKTLEEIFSTYNKKKVFEKNLITQEKFSKEYQKIQKTKKNISELTNLENSYRYVKKYNFTIPTKEARINEFKQGCLKNSLDVSLSSHRPEDILYLLDKDSLVKKWNDANPTKTEHLKALLCFLSYCNKNSDTAPQLDKKSLASSWKEHVKDMHPLTILSYFTTELLEETILDRKDPIENTYLTLLKLIKDEEEQISKRYERMVDEESSDDSSDYFTQPSDGAPFIIEHAINGTLNVISTLNSPPYQNKNSTKKDLNGLQEQDKEAYSEYLKNVNDLYKLLQSAQKCKSIALELLKEFYDQSNAHKEFFASI